MTRTVMVLTGIRCVQVDPESIVFVRDKDEMVTEITWEDGTIITAEESALKITNTVFEALKQKIRNGGEIKWK